MSGEHDMAAQCLRDALLTCFERNKITRATDRVQILSRFAELITTELQLAHNELPLKHYFIDPELWRRNDIE